MPGASPNPTGGYTAFTLPATFGEHLPMVELVQKSGSRVALPYPWLGAAEYHPARGITLVFTTGTTVFLSGRNLVPLFTALARHQAVSVVEADKPTAELLPEHDTVVDLIRVEPTGETPRPPGA